MSRVYGCDKVLVTLARGSFERGSADIIGSGILLVAGRTVFPSHVKRGNPCELTMPERDRDRIAEFKEVAELMPDDPVVRFGLAGAYLEAGLAESAVLEYAETIRLKPDYSAAHRGLGRALERAGRREEARAAYGKGLEVAARTGDLQTKKEIEVFIRRLDTTGS